MSYFPLNQEPGKHGRSQHVCVHVCVVLNGIQSITGTLLEARVEHCREYVWLKPDTNDEFIGLKKRQLSLEW